MAIPKEKAYDALLNAIAESVTELQEADLHVTQQAAALNELALAFRYVVGGSQPGNTVVAK